MRFLLPALCALVSLLVPVQASAGVIPPGGPIVVDSFLDVGGDTTPGDSVCAYVPSGGLCTLRAAIMEANARPGADTIILPAGTYTLAIAGAGDDLSGSGDLDIRDSVTIIGSGGNRDGDRSATIVQAQGIPNTFFDRVFEVISYSPSVNAAFECLTIRHGDVVGQSGGGISFHVAAGSLNLYNTAIEGNRSGADGGGVAATGPLASPGAVSVTIEKSVVRSNSTAARDGGGLFMQNVALVVRDTELSGNTAPSAGALAILGSATSVSIERTLISGNSCGPGCDGGAILVAAPVPVTITDSTFSGNVAGSDGGAIHVSAAAAVALRNVTATANRAESGYGGAMRINFGSVTVNNSIFFGNSAVVEPDLSGSVYATGSANNIVGSGTAGLVHGVNGNFVGVDPFLAPLADNGGPTRTHALLAGSPAIDAGANGAASSTDQRGSARVADSSDADATATVDIGAFEAHPTISDVTNKNGLAGTPIVVPFYVGDASLGLALTATSSNQSVVPNAGLVLSNADSHNPTLTITGVTAGTATITVSATSGSGTVSDTFDVTLTGGVDLSLGKAHVGTLRQGVSGDYKLMVVNGGTVASSGTVTVTDSLPSMMTATALSGPGWTCTLGTLTCTRNDSLPAGASWAAITLTVDIAGSGSMTNVATISGGGDARLTNNTASDTTFVTPASELELTLIGPATVVPGESSSHAVEVRNLGPSATTRVDIVVNATAGVTYTGVSGTDWNCSWSLTSIMCDRGSLAVGASSTVTATFTVDPTVPAQVTVTSSALTSNDFTKTKNSDTHTITVARDPDLTIAKTHVGNFRQGGTGDYTITVTNSGSAPTAGTVTMVDTLPAALTATAISGTGWTCDLPSLTCTTSDVLAGGASFPPITLSVSVAADAPSDVVNFANVSGGGETATGNNEAIDGTTIVQVADLVPSVTDGGGSFSQGDDARIYEVYVQNDGNVMSDAPVSIAMSISPGLTLDSVTPSAGWTCTASPLVCSTSDPIWPGAGSFLAAIVRVDVAVDAPPVVSLTATVSGGGEAVTSNNLSADTTPVIQMPDLTITKTHAGELSQGGVATYTIRVSNAGSGPNFNNVIVTDAPPAELAVTAIGGPGWSCDLMALTCIAYEPLAPGASYPDITLTGNVSITAPPTITNTATVSGTDRDSSNNTATDVASVQQLPDMVIEKRNLSLNWAGKSGSEYRLLVWNIGAAPSTGEVVVTEVPPAGLTVTSMSGNGWTCDTVTCRRSDSLAPGLSWDPIQVLVDISRSAEGLIRNVATVSGGGELAIDNNSADATIFIRAFAFSPDFLPDAQLGVAYQQQISVSGDGTPPYAFSIVSGSLPAGVTLASDGRLSGTPLAAGNFTFEVQSLDSNNNGDRIPSWKTYTLTVAVSASATSIAAAPITYGDPASVAVTVSSAAGITPTGSVTLSVDGSPVATQTLTGGTTTFSIPSLAAGTRVLAAAYAGDSNHHASSASADLQVSKAASSFTVDAPPIFFGDDARIQVTSAGGASTGPVDVTVNGVTLSQPLAGGSASFVVSGLDAGTWPVALSYAGDANFTGSSTSSTLLVEPAMTTMSVAAASIVYGGDGVVTVTVSSSAGAPAGDVSLSVDGGAPQVQLLVGGTATFTISSPNAGDHLLVATYGGASNFASSTATATLHVEPASTTTSFAAPSIVYGSDGIVTVTLSSAAGTPSGNVSLTVDGGAALVQSLVAGVATFTIPTPDAGDHALVASYAGEANFGASNATSTLHVDTASTTTSIAAPSITYGSDGIVTLTLSSAAGTPSGNVSLTVDGGAALVQSLVAGVATFTIPTPDAGDHALVASYAGDANFGASNATSALHVEPASTTTSIAAPSIIYGNDGIVTVTVSSVATIPSGSVSLTVDGGTAIVQPLVAGVATFTLIAPGTGDHSLVATYDGAPDFATSTATAVLTVAKASTSVSIATVSPSPSLVGESVTVTFAVDTNEGDVTISAGAYSCTTTASAGSCTIMFHEAGTYGLVASYAGSSNFEPSVSSSFPHTVEHPVGDAVVSGDATICADEEATISVELTGTAPWTLVWSDGVSETASSSPHHRTVRPDSTTVYTLTSAADANRSMTIAGSAQIVVRDPLPAPSIEGPAAVALGESFTLEASPGYDSYQWYRNGRILANETSRHLVIAAASSTDLATYAVVGFLDGCVSRQSAAFEVTAEETDSLIATIVGSVDGANGSRFRSALHLFNRGTEQFEGTLSFVTAGAGGGAAATTLALLPRETRWYGELFGGSGLASADLAIQRGIAPFGLVHVYNDLGAGGTTGLLQPLVDSAQVLAQNDRAVLLAPADPVATRFNIGIRTLRDGASLRYTVRDANGVVRSTAARDFAANFFAHLSATGFLGITPGPSDSITFELTAGSAIVYGASTDNVTNDPNIQFAQRVFASGDVRRVVPVVGSTAGAFGSRFRTSLQLFNSDTESRVATITVRPHGVVQTFAIAPHATVAIDDLLPAMGLEGLGTADVVANPAVAMVVRVFNDGEGETSMTEELVDDGQLLAAGDVATILAPHDPSKARFNVGIRAMDAGATLVLTVRSPQGVVLATRELGLAAHHFQHTSALDATGHVFTGDESVTVSVTAGQAVVYGVWTDNITNDPSFHVAR